MGCELSGFHCRLCGSAVSRTFVDLGTMPSANAYLRPDQLDAEEPRHRLHVFLCDECLLVQVDEMVRPEVLFHDYAYFSSYSESWVEHARRFAQSAIANLSLGPESLVVELASNDGYLLQHFRDGGIPVLGIEPAANVAEVARQRGIPTEAVFFGRATAETMAVGGQVADLLVANNVLAHVPDLNDFVAGMARVLKPSGVLSIEVPHLLRLIEGVQFDTIYHEHFSYFSLATAERALVTSGLAVFDVEVLPTHGGSLRIWGAPRDAGRPESERVAEVRSVEQAAGLYEVETYAGFAASVERCRDGVAQFLATARATGDTVAAYGAAAKGNTLLNYCGVTTEDIVFVADRSVEKQGKLLPGCHVPIRPPEAIFESRPDYVVILPWNLRAEIMNQLADIRQWGGRFVTFVPEVVVAP